MTPASVTDYDRDAVAKRTNKPAHSANRGGGKEESSSFGRSLRQQRELRKITLREVSEATKINIRYLEALERDEFQFLPGGAFTRGFIRSYARHIGIDEDEAINSYLYELRNQQEEAEPDADQPAKSGGDSVSTLMTHYEIAAGTDDRRRRRARILVVVLAVVVLAAAVAGVTLWLTGGFDSLGAIFSGSPGATK